MPRLCYCSRLSVFSDIRKNLDSPDLMNKLWDSPGFFKNDSSVSTIPPLFGKDFRKTVHDTDPKDDKS